MENWKKILISSVILFVTSVILKCIISYGIFWEILSYVLYLSIFFFVVSLIWGFCQLKKDGKKLPVWFVIILSIILSFGVIFIFVNSSNKVWEKNEKDAVEKVKAELNGTSTKSSVINTLNEMEMNNSILKKWNVTLPMNNTNDLECAVYNSKDNELYLQYIYGICVVNSKNEINRYMEFDSMYTTIKNKINKAKNSNVDGYKYMTANEFKKIIN